MERHFTVRVVGERGSGWVWAAALSEWTLSGGLRLVYRAMGNLSIGIATADEAQATARAHAVELFERVMRKRRSLRAFHPVAALPASLERVLCETLNLQATSRLLESRNERLEALQETRARRLTSALRRYRLTRRDVTLLEQIQAVGSITVQRGRRDESGMLLKTLAHPGSTATKRRSLDRLEQRRFLSVVRGDGVFGAGTVRTYTLTASGRDLVASLVKHDAPPPA